MKSMIIKEIGQRIRLIRKKQNLLQKDFCKELNVSGSSLSAMEAGHIKPNFELLYNISSKFNVNLCFLLHGKGDIFISQEKEDITALRKMLDQEGEIANWLKEFLYYFKYSPLVRYAMMSYFSEFLLTRMEIIDADIKNNRK